MGKQDVEHTADPEVKRAIVRLKEFSFPSMRREEGGRHSYEMHKLVQEAVQYGLRVKGRMEKDTGSATSGPSESEAYYTKVALQFMDDIFPISRRKSWAQCQQYLTHAIRVVE